MSVQVLCPSCGEVTAFHRPPVVDCPRCHQPLPEQICAATTRALSVDKAPKPALLVLGQIFSLFAAAIFLILLLAAPFNAGWFTIDGQEVSGPEFLKRAGWLFVAIGVLLAVIGIGLLRDAPWSRPLMLVYWILIPLSLFFSDPIEAADIVGVFFFTAFCGGIAWWYLYRKSNVRAYFEAREGAPGR
jgi:hypothetical protein